jgi:hypothetical protein
MSMATVTVSNMCVIHVSCWSAEAEAFTLALSLCSNPSRAGGSSDNYPNRLRRLLYNGYHLVENVVFGCSPNKSGVVNVELVIISSYFQRPVLSKDFRGGWRN